MNAVQASIHFLRNLFVLEDGQDLVEYALVFSMIAFGSVTGMGYLATGINTVFSTVGSTLSSSIS